MVRWWRASVMDVYVHCSWTILSLVIGFGLVGMVGGLAGSAENGSRQEVMRSASMIICFRL